MSHDEGDMARDHYGTTLTDALRDERSALDREERLFRLVEDLAGVTQNLIEIADASFPSLERCYPRDYRLAREALDEAKREIDK